MTDYLIKYSGYLTITAPDADTALDKAALKLPENCETLEVHDEMPTEKD